MKELLDILRTQASRPDLPYALATVVKVEGSSYRKPGARMLVGSTGRLAGSVSGGCLERDVVSKGLTVILSGTAQLLVYDTTDQDDLAFGSSLGCEGRIEILVQPVPSDTPWALAILADKTLRQRRPVGLATVFGGEAAEGYRGGMLAFLADEKITSWEGPELPVSRIEQDLARVLESKKPLTRSYATASGSVEILLERIAPPQSLIIFGGGHDVPPLVRLARELGHEITVVDRRVDFAEPQRFPGADRVLQARPVQVAERVALEADSAVVIMNHHYETDAELLGLLLPTPLAYLGMLGPRKRTDKILGELQRAGAVFSDDQMRKLHAPAGLDLGSENPEQIALCILAEIQASLSGRSAAKLRDRLEPIHAMPPLPTECVPSASFS